jgi:hypothetical protein
MACFVVDLVVKSVVNLIVYLVVLVVFWLVDWIGYLVVSLVVNSVLLLLLSLFLFFTTTWKNHTASASLGNSAAANNAGVKPNAADGRVAHSRTIYFDTSLAC